MGGQPNGPSTPHGTLTVDPSRPLPRLRNGVKYCKVLRLPEVSERCGLASSSATLRCALGLSSSATLRLGQLLCHAALGAGLLVEQELRGLRTRAQGG